MKNKKQGISLIVLVITIIVIIILAGAVILSMMQNNPTTKAKEAIFKTDIATYKDELTMYHLTKTVDALGNYEKSSLNKSGQDLKEVISSIKEADIEKFEIKAGELVYIGTAENEIKWAKEILMDPNDLPGAPEEPEYGVNVPVLAKGMTPIKWNGSAWINTTKNDTGWYNYENKEWANAKTADGSFWVWIPRYEYKIPTPHTNVAQSILVNFKGNKNMDATSGYTIHPAFTFGTTQLTGIWVAKFEATAREGVVNTAAGDNVTTKNIKILPDVESWRTITISNMFDVARKIQTDEVYGFEINEIDSHLMKNVEWGAVAYISHSKYGKNEEVLVNDSSKYYTGGGQDNAYITNVVQSTTGNITGIYDMSGGSYEYTSAYVDNENSNLITNGASLINSTGKYKDIYQKGTSDERQISYDTNLNKKGDAVYETSSKGTGNYSWYGSQAYMPYSSSPFFVRGGVFSASNTGMFSFYSNTGTSNSSYGFRPVLSSSDNI